jgi:thiol-disulfide isomerase/thioredoxin
LNTTKFFKLYTIKLFKFINILTIFITLSLSAQDLKQQVVFHKSYQEGIKLAKINHKAVLLDFFAEWCEPCKVMDNEVLVDPTLSRFFNSNFISIKIDGESKEGKKLMKDYLVTGFPTYIFINKKGKTVNRISGALEAKQFLQMGRETIDPANSLDAMRKKFIEDPNSKDKMINLLTLLSSEDISEISGILDYHYFRNKKINLKNLWNDIKTYAPLNNSRCINFARKKIDTLYQFDKKENVDKWLQVTCAKTMLWAIKELDEVSFLEARSDYGEPTTREEKQSLDVILLDFYGRMDLEKFRINARLLAEGEWKGDWEVLNVISEQYLQKTNRKDDLEEGIKFVDKSISINENASNLDTKALLLNKIGKKNEAKLLAERVQILYQKDPGSYKGLELKSKNLLK